MSLSVSCVQTRSNAINFGLANKSPGSKSVYEKRCEGQKEVRVRGKGRGGAGEGERESDRKRTRERERVRKYGREF